MTRKSTITMTDKAPTVALSTPVSICIGSDQYAARVVSVTAATVTVEYARDGERMTFRPSARGRWVCGSYRLRVGESVERLDPCF